MPGKNIIVIGASSGGLEALRALIKGLPADLPASIFVVLHTSPSSTGIVADILERGGPLTATQAKNRERIVPGHIYVAPPDCHLLLEPGIIRVTRGPKENGFRPAVDPLFRSAAQVYGPRVIGIVLSGGLDDGTSGLWIIKKLGGTAIVQSPEDALVSSMPRNAMRSVDVDLILPASEMAPVLTQLVRTPIEGKGWSEMPEEVEIELKIAKEAKPLDSGIQKLGSPSIFTCPECHGALLQLQEGDRIRFRCHTGHAFTPDSLLSEMTTEIENGLWSTIRSIQESAILMRHMAEHLKQSKNDIAAAKFLDEAAAAEHRSEIIRQTVLNPENVKQGSLA